MNRIVLLLLVFFIVGIKAANAEKLTFTSFNICNHNLSDSVNGNGWKKRCPVICDLICFDDFEIYGAQEVLCGQLLGMQAGEFGSYYVGVGCSDGKNKEGYALAFYQKENFKALESKNVLKVVSLIKYVACTLSDHFPEKETLRFEE